MSSPMNADDEQIQTLSNEDIETLYDIVRYAQTLPGRPFRALFQAYDKVLEEKGIVDDGSRYLRFLFRIQDVGDRAEEGIVERFQRLLGDMGIQVECDPEGEGIEEITRDVGAAKAERHARTESVAGAVSRRGSFESFFDGTADKVLGPDGTPRKHRGRRGSYDAVSDSGAGNKRRSKSNIQARGTPLGQLPIRSRMNENVAARASYQNAPDEQQRKGSVSSRGSPANGEIRHDGYSGDESEHTDSFDRSHLQIPGVNAPIPGTTRESPQPYVPSEGLYRPSDTQMLDDAETFEDRRLVAVARSALQNWRNRTRDMIEGLDEMNTKAYAFDRKILLKASLESWYIAFQNKRQLQETEQFFKRLEKRAGKARNLFLLTKAFTHWAMTAEDEVQRTSVARRHILRTKYFNAWRDITAVNELKVQHFVLGKFLLHWRRRTAVIREDNDLAVALYTQNLVYKIYWRWFWAFCDRRAPIWNAQRTKRNVVERWADIVRVLKERERWAADRRDRELVRRAFARIREKMNTARLQEDQAQEHREKVLLGSTFQTLQKQAALAPLAVQFRVRVDERRSRTAVKTWQRNTQMSRQAASVDRMRVLCNAFTAWNDRLRTQALTDQINDRIMVEALYKWALASRASLFIRVRNRGLKQSAFTTWVDKARQRHADLQDAERRFANFKRDQLLRSVLHRIVQATVERRDQEYLAMSIYEPKVKQRMLGKLLKRHHHLQQLDTWASDAQFYVTTTNAIRRWKEATQHARRNRRRESYAHVRRMVKTNLIRRTLGAWREKANQRIVQAQQADSMFEQRLLSAKMICMAQWQDRTAALRDANRQATQRHDRKLTTTAFKSLYTRYELLQTMDTQAIALRQESTEIVASSCLKKLRWRLWNLQRDEDKALALYQRNFEKHLRAMIRFWLEQTRDKLVQRPTSPTPGSRISRRQLEYDDHSSRDGHKEDGGPLDHQDDVTHRLENWTSLDEAGLGLLSPTNLDLSFSLAPQNRLTQPLSQTQPHISLPQRPKTHPPPQSSVSRPPPIPEMSDIEDEELGNLWTSTPMPSKPGYLKTPSKRSVARAKRPELPASPEKKPPVQDQSIVGLERGLGVMSAPPAQNHGRGTGMRADGVTSFESRLRASGFGASVGPRVSSLRKGGIMTRTGKARVGFEDLEQG